MELTVKLENDADVSFIKKLLLQLKDVKSVDISEDEMSDVDYDQKFDELLEKSKKQIEEGKFVEHSDELINSFFK